MKKRFLSLMISIVATIVCAIGFSACGKTKYKLNFVVEGAIYATVETSGGEAIELPENPTKENHSFDGWYFDKDVWEEAFTANSLLDTKLSKDTAVYAKFSLNIIENVSFEDVNTVYDGTEKTIAVSNLPQGASVVYDKANSYVNAGEYTVTATISQDNYEDLQLTATLTINKATYDMSGVVFANKNVTYNGQVHSIIATNLPNGVSASYTGNNRTNAGEYYVEATFTGDSVNYEPIAKKTVMLTISKAVPSVLVSCNQILTLASTVELVAEADVAGTIKLDDGQELVVGDKEYSWTFIPQNNNYINVTGTINLTVLAVVSYYNEGVLYESQNVARNSLASIPTIEPTKADSNGIRYSFSHWSVEENGDEYDFTNAIQSDLSLYAVYNNENIIYNIYINNAGGVGETEVEIAFGGTYSLTEPTKTGFDFVKWVRVDAGAETDFAASGTYSFTESIVIKAVWAEQTNRLILKGITKLDIVDYAMLGQVQTIEGGVAIDMKSNVLFTAPNPIRSGVYFACWVDADGKYVELPDYITEDMEVTALFEEIQEGKNIVVFIEEGFAPVVKHVEIGTTLTDIPTIQTEEAGYTFSWNADLSNVTENMVVKTVKTEKVYKIFYRCAASKIAHLVEEFGLKYDEGLNCYYQEVKYLDSFELIDEIADNNYKLVGWEDVDGNSFVSADNYTLTQDIEIFEDVEKMTDDEIANDDSQWSPLD